jgi:hypothetical protein
VAARRFTRKGSFDEKTFGVIWLWDQLAGRPRRNTVILHGAPTADGEAEGKAGSARIYDPNDTAFKDGKVTWTVEAEVLSDVRKKALALLDNMFPAPYGSQKWLSNPFHSKQPGPVHGYTNCVEFPAYLIYSLNLKKLFPGYPPTNLPGWTEADGKTKPKPGDIYTLSPGKVRVKTNAHIGVIYSTSWSNSNGLLWRTADWGQGSSGWDGLFIDRNYDPAAATLTGPASSPFPDARAIRGWLDLDLYAAASPKK